MGGIRGRTRHFAGGIIDAGTPDPSAAIEALGSNSLAIIDRRAGNTVELRNAIQMPEGQAIVGAGSRNLRLKGSVTGNLIWFDVPGRSANLEQTTAGADAIHLPRRNGQLVGLSVRAPRQAISGTDISNVRLWNVRTRNNSPDEPPADAAGLVLRGDRMHVDITSSRFSHNRDGMILEGIVTGRIFNNDADQNMGTGVRVEGDLQATFWSNVVSRNGQGMVLNGRLGDSAGRNSFSFNEQSGLLINGPFNGKLTNNSAHRNGGHGFHFTDLVDGEVTGNTATRNGGRGFLLEQSPVGVFQENASEDNAGDTPGF